MADLHSLYEEHSDLSEEKQVKAGKAISGTMGDAHTAFVKKICAMIQEKTIDPSRPETFMNMSVVEKLNDADRSKVDVASINVADQLRHVAEFYLSKQTPDASPQLENMIEHLWQMKTRIEVEHGEVFTF